MPPLHFIPTITLERALARGTLCSEDFRRLHESGMPILSGLGLEYGGDDPAGHERARCAAELDAIPAHKVLSALRSVPVQGWLVRHQFERCVRCGHSHILSSCEHCYEAISPLITNERLKPDEWDRSASLGF